jgi:hypothetical protein
MINYVKMCDDVKPNTKRIPATFKCYVIPCVKTTQEHNRKCCHCPWKESPFTENNIKLLYGCKFSRRKQNIKIRKHRVSEKHVFENKCPYRRHTTGDLNQKSVCLYLGRWHLAHGPVLVRDIN